MISTRTRIALAFSALVLLAGGGAWYAMASQAKPAAAGTVYRCPMHPETAYDKPGRCPLCGMNLVPAEAGAPPASPSCGAGPGGGCCGGNEPVAPSK